MQKRNSPGSRYLSGAGLLAVTLLLVACGKDAGGPPPPPEVGVITLAPRAIAITDQLPGRTTAYRVAEVRPQVTGIVQKRLFSEGGEVKAGEQLYQIDAGSYRATYESAVAALQRAEAQAVTAKLLQERYAPLIAANAVSKQENDDAIAARARADADVAAARAQVANARINVVYTQVLSPINGRIGRALVTEGALVTSNQESPLATVQQLDPIYVDITQSSTEMLRLQRQVASGEMTKNDNNEAEVGLTLEDGTLYSRTRAPQGFRSVGGSEHGLGAVARRVPESKARTAARHVRARPAHAWHALRGAARAAARCVAKLEG